APPVWRAKLAGAGLDRALAARDRVRSVESDPSNGGSDVNNRPYGHELLGVGRRVLLDELLPLLPADKTYDVLMIANAMAIAARELEPHCERDDGAVQAIARFYEEAGLDEPGAATEHRLAALIRARAISPLQQERLHGVLRSLTEVKLALSNPKYLRRPATEGNHEQ